MLALFTVGVGCLISFLVLCFESNNVLGRGCKCPCISSRRSDLQNVTIHTIWDGVKFFRACVKFENEHTVYCRKFNLFSQFYIFWGVEVLENARNNTLRMFLKKF